MIFNNLPYAPPIEIGSKGKPWETPGPKTVLYNGRVYSKQAPGGVFDKIITTEKLDEIAESLIKDI